MQARRSPRSRDRPISMHGQRVASVKDRLVRNRIPRDQSRTAPFIHDHGHQWREGTDSWNPCQIPGERPKYRDRHSRSSTTRNSRRSGRARQNNAAHDRQAEIRDRHSRRRSTTMDEFRDFAGRLIQRGQQGGTSRSAGWKLGRRSVHGEKSISEAFLFLCVFRNCGTLQNHSGWFNIRNL